MFYNCKNAVSAEIFVALKVGLRFWVITQPSTSADALFNDVLSDPEFKLTGLILKTCWPFAN